MKKLWFSREVAYEVGFIVRGKAAAEAEIQIISSLEHEILTQQETQQTFNVMVSQNGNKQNGRWGPILLQKIMADRHIWYINRIMAFSSYGF